MVVVIFLNAVVTVDVHVLTEGNNDVKLVEI